MIESFINSKLKSLTLTDAISATEKEKTLVAQKLKTYGCDVTQQKHFLLKSDEMAQFHYFHNLDWLCNLLQGTSITYNDYMKHHTKLKKRLEKFGLI